MPDANLCITCEVFQKCFAAVLPKKEIEFLSKEVVREEFKKGDLVCTAGKPANFVYIAVRGQVLLEHEGAGSYPIILRNVKESECFGLEAFTHEGIYLTTAKARNGVVLCKLNRETIDTLMKSNPKMFNRVVAELYAEKKVLLDYLVIVNSGSPQTRLAYALLNLSNVKGMVLATKEEMAQMARLRRETVSRILKTFKERKILVLEGRTIKIADRKELENVFFHH